MAIQHAQDPRLQPACIIKSADDLDNAVYLASDLDRVVNPL